MAKSLFAWAFSLVAVSCLLFDTKAAESKKRPSSAKPATLTMVVMDPLAAPLSCPCVEGYAQRKYEVLARQLEKTTGESIRVVFSESLEVALKGEAKGKADLIIGKDSVVRADAKAAKLKTKAIARLTGKNGLTTQTGLIVVHAKDTAKSVSDLKGYKIIFGPKECDEKHAAAMDLLKKNGVTIPEKLAIDEACSEGASKVVELGKSGKTAAVISSYAEPLLEGCGTIKKGDLKVVGKTKPVPFVTAFVNRQLNAKRRTALQNALDETSLQPEVLVALESLVGFEPIEADKKKQEKASVAIKKK